jgi:NAD(P)-dependent dehydrogenase (short-subunit alcohol dehydrogenase family)
MADLNQRSAAVTGAGSGLGRDIALGLAAKGYRVFGTAMTAEDVAELHEASAGRVALTRVDITHEGAVKRWAEEVGARTGGALDLLVSNAGILTPGPVEVLPLDAIRREFEVNVFGVLSVVNAFLPALRKARGRIVQISTWTAAFPLPFNGPSGASKAAAEVFANVYRAELRSFGVDVVIVSAGSMRTGGPAKTAAALARVSREMTAGQRDLYGETFGTFAATLNRLQDEGIDSAAAAAGVIEIAERVPAPSRVPLGPDAEQMLRLARERTDAELDALRLEIVGLGQAAPA